MFLLCFFVEPPGDIPSFLISPFFHPFFHPFFCHLLVLLFQLPVIDHGVLMFLFSCFAKLCDGWILQAYVGVGAFHEVVYLWIRALFFLFFFRLIDRLEPKERLIFIYPRSL